jgi:ribosomal 50S subunit-associated protein YjgA (DUF615 family)
MNKRPSPPTTLGNVHNTDRAAAPPVAEPAPRPSKTQLKQQMHEWQRLGQRLVDLSAPQLARMELPELLHDQIGLAHRVRGARRCAGRCNTSGA